MEQYSREVLKKVARTDNLVVLIFGAEWCGPCKRLHKILDEIIPEYREEKIRFIYVDVDLQREFTVKLLIKSVPQVLFMKKGRLKEKLVGTQTKKEYLDLIKKYLF